MIFDLTDALMGLVGGLLIGLAAALLLLGNGKIAGISGIAARTIRPVSSDRAETVAFLVGLIGAPALYAILVAPPALQITQNTGVLIAGGLLVGIGTTVGNGCTSGHGVCGVSRLSLRSILATATFMIVAVLATTFLRPALGGW